MNRTLRWLVFSLLLVAFSTTAAVTKIKVLVVTGGHGFEKEPFLQIFRDNPQIEFTHAAHSGNSSDVYDRDDLFSYDAVFLYDMMQKITDQQKARFLALCERGIGLVVTHHALVSYRDWPDFERIIGGAYPEDQTKKGVVTAELGYQHDVTLPVSILARDHPITAGLTNFVIVDEIYWGFRVGPDVVPLITTSHPKSGKPLAWYRQEKNSRVVYLQLGHGPSAYHDPNYRKLVAQSIRWAARK